MGFSEDNSRENGTKKPPRPAATVILVRETQHGLETYLLKRSAKSGFFPGAYVFPGGALDKDDTDFRFWKEHINMDMKDVERRFGGEGIKREDVLGYCVAGIRETFEEAGVFLAHNSSRSLPEKTCNARTAEGLEKGWLRNMACSDGWVLDLASLSRWSHWITPEGMKYHFDALFFAAIMPQGQSCTPDRRETEEGIWISPDEALTFNLAGTIPLSPPTIVTMHELLSYHNIDSLKKAWRTKPWGSARLPRMVQTENGPVILEPWDPQYNYADYDLDTTGIESLVLPPCESFSRLFLHNGIWKPVRIR